MKLIHIWLSQHAWKQLSALKKPPKIAYRLMKYAKTVSAEVGACDEQRIQYVYDVSGASPGSPVELPTDSPEYQDFLSRFNEFLRQDSDLKPLDMSMDELIDSLESEKGNVLSEEDLAALEPFFQKKPDLKEVKHGNEQRA